MTTQAFTSSMDVTVSLSSAQNAVRTNLSTLCFVTLYKSTIADKVRFYTSQAAVASDWGADSEAAKAATFFFEQSPIPAQMAVGQLSSGWTDIAAELALIAAAAKTINQNIYGWCLEASLRVAATQEAAAAWVAATVGFMTLVTNDVNAYDSGHTDDIGSIIKATANKRVECIFHDNAAMYPDVSILAYMLGVNYLMQDSTVTAKFVQMPGISTVNITYNQWLVLKGKGYNMYSLMDNGTSVFREGTNEDTAGTQFMDNVINMDNFVTDLQTNVYNVFLRNKKVPYTAKGQMMLVDACKQTGNQYVFNGTFADSQVADSTQKSGYRIVPAVQVTPTPIYQIPASTRASRVGPPIQMVVQQAGAIHSVAINVSVVD